MVKSEVKGVRLTVEGGSTQQHLVVNEMRMLRGREEKWEEYVDDDDDRIWMSKW